VALPGIDFECEDDASALQRALELEERASTGEVWKGMTRVGLVTRQCAPAQTAGPASQGGGRLPAPLEIPAEEWGATPRGEVLISGPGG
jgi:hypothetical protein